MRDNGRTHEAVAEAAREGVYWTEYHALMERLRELEVLSYQRWGRERPTTADEAQAMRQLRLGLEALEVGFEGE